MQGNQHGIARGHLIEPFDIYYEISYQVKNVPALLTQFQGNERQLCAEIESVYGRDPRYCYVMPSTVNSYWDVLLTVHSLCCTGMAGCPLQQK